MMDIVVKKWFNLITDEIERDDIDDRIQQKEEDVCQYMERKANIQEEVLNDIIDDEIGNPDLPAISREERSDLVSYLRNFYDI